MYTTGTFRIDQKDVPFDVTLMKEVLNGQKISCGSGYYYHPAVQALTSQSSSDVATTCVQFKMERKLLKFQLTMNHHPLFIQYGGIHVLFVLHLVFPRP